MKRSIRRQLNPLMSECKKHEKAIGNWRAHTHQGPASTHANLRGRIYERSRPNLHPTTGLQNGEESIYGRSLTVDMQGAAQLGTPSEPETI